MSSFDLAGNFLQQYLPSLYRSSIVETGFGRSFCNASFASYFQLDTQSYEFTVDFYGSNSILTLTSPDGMEIPMPDPIFVSDINYLGVIVVNASGFVKPGTYKLTMSSTEPTCGLTIRARSIIETFVGYTQVTDSVNGATQDDAHFAPLVGPNNIPLVHIRNPRGSTLTYIQFVDIAGFLSYSSDLRVRDSACTFQYYGTKTFNCRAGDTFVTYVYGIDGNGYNFRRTQMSHCVFGRDRPPPPPAFCTLTDRVYDILFLLDSSMSQTGPNFDQLIKQYVRMVTKDYAISSTQTQVAVLTVSDAARTAFTLAQSNATNLAGLINAIPYQGGLGQDTTSALFSVIYDHSTDAAGYRSSARHLIVYVTGTTMWSGNDTEPEQVARSLRRSGTWGIAGVGVRLNDLFNLQSLTNGGSCVYSATSDEDLFTNAVNFIQSMTCFRVPLCNDG